MLKTLYNCVTDFKFSLDLDRATTVAFKKPKPFFRLFITSSGFFSF